MFDTHCHLNSFYDYSPASPSLKSLFDCKQFFLSVTTHNSDWLPSLEFARNLPNILPAVGLHPWFVSNNFAYDLVVLRDLLATYPITAIGEIGLDFSHTYKSTQSWQLACLQQQLQLAIDYQLPVSLHCVKAHNELISLLKCYPVKGVVHGLGTSVQVAQQYVDLGFKFGVNGISVRDNAVRYHALIKHFGLQHIVLETDYPNINLPGLPEPQLEDISIVAKQVATLLHLPVEDVVEQTDYNASQIFKFKS